ncbi:MAG TPA: hypothetical protein VHJ77_12425 [Vicinamibacterales bacterium]|nr:hypothetical protein [Vicinamibacterales bacterium]
MSTHRFIRAYMAGSIVPTAFLLVVMTAFTLARYAYHVPLPIERIVVFPMAVVPNMWGLWNALYLVSPARRLALGLHGAVLPFILAPAGFLVAQFVNFPIPAVMVDGFPFGFPVVVIVYYLAWKYLVGFFNEIVDVS